MYTLVQRSVCAPPVFLSVARMEHTCPLCGTCFASVWGARCHVCPVAAGEQQRPVAPAAREMDSNDGLPDSDGSVDSDVDEANIKAYSLVQFVRNKKGREGAHV